MITNDEYDFYVNELNNGIITEEERERYLKLKSSYENFKVAELIRSKLSKEELAIVIENESDDFKAGSLNEMLKMIAKEVYASMYKLCTGNAGVLSTETDIYQCCGCAICITKIFLISDNYKLEDIVLDIFPAEEEYIYFVESSIVKIVDYYKMQLIKEREKKHARM